MIFVIKVTGWWWSSQENGTRPEYELASEGVNQAQLAGELFQKVLSFFRKMISFVGLLFLYV